MNTDTPKMDQINETEREIDMRRRITAWQNQTINDLARERDEARAEMIRWMSIAEGRGRTDDDDTGKAMAKLIRQRDEARGQVDALVDRLGKTQERMIDAERILAEAGAEMIRWMSIAEGRGRTDETLSNQ